MNKSIKLTEEKVLQIRQRTANFWPYKSEPLKNIAADFGVSIQCICSVMNRRTWNRASAIPQIPEPAKRSPFRKLTPAQVREIRMQREQGEKLEVIALNFGVSFSNVRSIVERIIWKGVA
jgi:hypothetical protein